MTDTERVALLPCPLCSSALISYETHRGGETFHRHPQTSTCPLAGVRIAPEAITAWNTRPLSMTGEGWQPIETAPKDAPIRLYDPELDFSADNWGSSWDGHWLDGEGWQASVWHDDQDAWLVQSVSPSHWQPLPEPPAAIQEQGGMSELIADKAQFAVGTYSDGSGPIATVAYDTTSQYCPGSVWVYGGDYDSDRWVAFDWQHADAIADAIKQAAAALRARASKEKSNGE